ncbi:hypothetical protein ACFL6S_31260 [Candidatus Poribacteria bacterium]
MVISKITVTTVMAFIILVIGTGIVVAQDLVHDEDQNTTCDDCHIMHNHLGPSLTGTGETNNLCGSCHIWSGSGDDVGTHQGLSCTTCHYPHERGSNIDAVREQIETPPPNSEIKDVIFTVSSGIHSFADGDGIYDGICEVCHTETKYHRNDPSGDHSHNVGSNCTVADCHMHSEGMRHGGPCENCHGHDDGWNGGVYYKSTVSHSTHTENDSDDLRGPNPVLACDYCHASEYPYFRLDKDDTGDNNYSLSETNICDECHSPGGSYNGVDSMADSVGAKDNWSSGVYSGNVLAPGKEKWCAGCHDNAPAIVAEVYAPAVVGDEDAATNYGTGYGFYKTGHGVAPPGTYPASGDAVLGAGLSCEGCHDATMVHIDSVARTYDYSAAIGASNDYQHGYRLNLVDGQLPMNVPRTGDCSDSGVVASDFRLCFDCHNPDPFTTDDNVLTNFRRAGTPPFNSHYFHLAIMFLCDYGPVYQSDWRSHGNDSRGSCVTCHNVHGSTQLSMVRDGKLVNRGSGQRVAYYEDGASYGCFEEPNPADVTLLNSTGTIYSQNTPLCSTCHGSCGFDSLYLRSPERMIITNQDPSDGEVNVAVDHDIAFTLSGTGSAVDWTTFSIHLSGNRGYTQTYYDTSSEVSEIGTEFSYNVTVNPDVNFAEAEVITATVNVDDLSTPANPMTPTPWSFITLGGTPDTLILHPSGFYSSPGGTWSPINGTWAEVLEDDDADDTYATSSTGGVYELYVDMDDPTGLGGATIQDITIYVHARYVTAGGPAPRPPYAGWVDIGYQTGTNVVWRGDFRTDGVTGDYDEIISDTYTTDSDEGLLELTDINNLQIAIKRLSSGAVQLRITEIRVEVTYIP